MPRLPLVANGWALGGESPIAEALVVVDDRTATAARLGFSTPEIAARHPGVPGAERCGWATELDLRGAPGPEVRMALLVRMAAGEWRQLDHVEIRVEAPGALAGRSRAAFTIAQNEPRFLPLWLRHYGRHFDPADIYVLDHDSSDGSTEGLEGVCNVVPVHREESFDHMWLRGAVEDFQSFLLRSYETVLFAEVDELVVADPRRYRDLGHYMDELESSAACCSGYNVVHYPEEAPLRFEEPILAQRRYWHPSPNYSKRLVARIPLSWNAGFHKEFNAPDALPDPDLYLIHLHRADYEYCLARHRAAASRKWPEGDLQWNLGWHQRVVEDGEFREWFFNGADLEGAEREPIPEHLRAEL